MNEYELEYIKYRFEKNDQAFKDALNLYELESYNASINRLHYACFYAVSAIALTVKDNTLTHSGIKYIFNNHFVKTNKISAEEGKFYSNLMNLRQKGDYGDLYDFTKDDVQKLFEPSKIFITSIKSLVHA